jgi:4a-hydroxytetrahydrobiopterin dehydratase
MGVFIQPCVDSDVDPKQPVLMPDAATYAQIQGALAALEGWRFSGNKLVKSFTFNDFKDSLLFINQVGALAEQLGHHPEIHNIWNRVTLALCTHDAGDVVTERDLQLARALQSLSCP